jgi:hypothetical protein
MLDGKRQKKSEGNEECRSCECNGPVLLQKAAFWKRLEKDDLEIWASKRPHMSEQDAHVQVRPCLVERFNDLPPQFVLIQAKPKTCDETENRQCAVDDHFAAILRQSSCL